MTSSRQSPLQLRLWGPVRTHGVDGDDSLHLRYDDYTATKRARRGLCLDVLVRNRRFGFLISNYSITKLPDYKFSGKSAIASRGTETQYLVIAGGLVLISNYPITRLPTYQIPRWANIASPATKMNCG